MAAGTGCRQMQGGEGGSGLGDSRLGCRCGCKRRHLLTLGSRGLEQAWERADDWE